MTFEEREKFVFQLMQEIRATDFVVIGGYALNAYTLPRFSLDCDFVVKSKKDGKKLVKFFKEKGFKKRAAGATQQREGFFVSMTAVKPVKTTVDLLIESVFDRISGTKISAQTVFEFSKKRTIYGKGAPIKVKARVADSELLFAMKAVSARKSDIRDVFMLSSIKLSESKLTELGKQVRVEKKTIKKIKQAVSFKQFVDALQGVYGKIDPSLIKKTKQNLYRNLGFLLTQK